MKLEDTFATYESLQRSLTDEAAVTMSPLTLVEKLNELNQNLVRVRKEYERIKQLKVDLESKHGKEMEDLEGKITSTLELLVAKKPNPAKK